MDFRVVDNLPEFQRSLGVHGRQVPFALALALTRTAQAAQEAEHREIGRVFHRPVALTQKAVFIQPATKSRLVATVGVKDDISKGTPPAKYLAAEIEGGARRQKRSERAIRASYPHLQGYWVPGSGIRLNAYGNVPASTIVRILSDIQAAETMSGYAANRTARSLARNKNYRTGRYFVPPPGSRLDKIAHGVWVRRGKTKVAPALIFVAATNYRRRFDFFAKGQQFVEGRFPMEFEEALRHAIATAR